MRPPVQRTHRRSGAVNDELHPHYRSRRGRSRWRECAKGGDGRGRLCAQAVIRDVPSRRSLRPSPARASTRTATAGQFPSSVLECRWHVDVRAGQRHVPVADHAGEFNRGRDIVQLGDKSFWLGSGASAQHQRTYRTRRRSMFDRGSHRQTSPTKCSAHFRPSECTPPRTTITARAAANALEATQPRLTARSTNRKAAGGTDATRPAPATVTA
jgi:hypothetical protein